MGILSKVGSARGRIAEERRPMRFVASRLLWKSGLSRRLTYPYADGARLRFHPSAMAATLWVDSDFNEDDRRALTEHLGLGDVVVDVGANIGALAISCATAVGPSGRVFAIEANPTTFRYLEENVELNGLSQITCLNYAAGAESGELRFTDDPKSAEQNTVDPEGPLTVPSEPLDSVIPQDVDIAVLKIDVEGFEKFVLEGAPSTLARTKRVYVEVWDEHFQRFGYSTVDILDALGGAGFETYRVDDQGQLSGTEGAGRVCENLLAVRA